MLEIEQLAALSYQLKQTPPMPTFTHKIFIKKLKEISIYVLDNIYNIFLKLFFMLVYNNLFYCKIEYPIYEIQR